MTKQFKFHNGGIVFSILSWSFWFSFWRCDTRLLTTCSCNGVSLPIHANIYLLEVSAISSGMVGNFGTFFNFSHSDSCMRVHWSIYKHRVNYFCKYTYESSQCRESTYWKHIQQSGRYARMILKYQLMLKYCLSITYDKIGYARTILESQYVSTGLTSTWALLKLRIRFITSYHWIGSIFCRDFSIFISFFCF